MDGKELFLENCGQFLISCGSSFHKQGWAFGVGNFFTRLLSIPPVSQPLLPWKVMGGKLSSWIWRIKPLEGSEHQAKDLEPHSCSYKAETKGWALKVALTIKPTGWFTFLVGYIYVSTPPLTQLLAGAFSGCVFLSLDTMSSNNTALYFSSSLILLASKCWSSRYT